MASESELASIKASLESDFALLAKTLGGNEATVQKRTKAFIAHLAREIGLPDSISTRVAGYVERTITHTLPPDEEVDSDLCLFLDFDLEVLSRSGADAKYAAQIQQEYSHMKLADYCAGRVKVLRSFLGRDRLYFSNAFYESHEERARANLEQEISSLEAIRAGSRIS
ncbi:unnamed protein product [Calypogeia fissa]